ncbi:MAG: hypothetical protein BRD29_04100, partial [Bacteroidetes bacterium QH_2_67_10]
MPRAPEANRTLKTENRPVRVVEIGLKRLGLIRALNREIFGEDHIINSFDREDLIMLLAEAREGGVPVGFKIGYRLSDRVFYS